MSASSLLSLGSQALFAAYRQVQTTSHNIANANTEGYSRQRNIQSTATPQEFGGGFLGRGVTVDTVERASNAFLTDRAASLKSAAASDTVVAGLLSQLEQMFPGGETGLGNAATQIFNSFADLAAAPSDLSARQAVIGRLQDFAALANDTAAHVESLQANVKSDLSGAVNEVNVLAQQLAGLNRQIATATASGHAPNDLLDQRDVLVSRIAEQLDVQTIAADDGSVGVFVATGQTLVLGATANKLSLQEDPYDRSKAGVGVTLNGKLTLLADGFITSGRIGGLLQFQAGDLNEARNRLGQFVAGVSFALNEQQSLGLDLDRQGGSALFSVGQPQALPANSNARDGSGAVIGTVDLVIEDASALRASDYLLRVDPADGNRFLVTRLADGAGAQAVSIANGDVYDGVRISAGASAPAADDRFLLRPLATAATDLSVALRNPRGLAAASPVVATVSSANQGTMSVAATEIVAPPAAGYGTLTLQFSDDAGNFDLLDSDGAVQGSGSFQPGQPVLFDGISLTLAGVPRTGDRIQIAPNLQPSASNGNALSLDALASRTLVGGQISGDAYASLFSQIGVRSQGATIAADSASTAFNRATEQLSGETGVNVDEEVARLIQYQQGYQAAAKILQTAQTLLDSVISMVGR
ncbi:flagellar hook-associated protein FlgK [Aquabacterium sp. OR-4]|uniref:flagellar hook-associated protein FlgK n=1 Tax=Aquabacterium sp. OR-4 TaxID=2978127 RepID=UPI0028C643A5|nr:flagellar hook-associated protein FlgK [Aquabacterium sp. OR-4]MDT7836186.1 flagellar hook-associated protein FlgK [Aquabacterium sp. OR-4]